MVRRTHQGQYGARGCTWGAGTLERSSMRGVASMQEWGDGHD